MKSIFIAALLIPLLSSCGPKTPVSEPTTTLETDMEPEAPTAANCAGVFTANEIKSVIFANSHSMFASDDEIMTMEVQSEVHLESAVADAVDKNLNKVTCTGNYAIIFPKQHIPSNAVAHIQYSIQLSADGSDVVYNVFGAESLVNAVSAAATYKKINSAANAKEPNRPQYAEGSAEQQGQAFRDGLEALRPMIAPE